MQSLTLSTRDWCEIDNRLIYNEPVFNLYISEATVPTTNDKLLNEYFFSKLFFFLENLFAVI